ncbi:MAG TPA: hypothetical protein VN442_18520, partial [Bryobacteraceae bacterium]|nr:hypothetical protein [Bryobacteraceae bacterium]
MGFDSTAELMFKVSADTGDAAGNMQRFRGLLSKDLGTIAAEFEGWSKRVFGDITTLGGATKAGIAAVATAAVAAGGAVWAAAEKTARFAEEIEDAENKTGIAVEGLSKLRFAAERTGLGWHELVAMLVRYEAQVVKGAQGDEKALAAFRAIGIHQKDLKRGTEDLLPLLMKTSDAFHGMSSTVEKAAEARELFGRSGANTIEWLSLGSEAIRQFGERAAHLGRVLTEEDVIAAKAFKLANQELKAEMDGLWFQIGTVGLPILQKVSVFMIAVAETMKKDTGGPIAEIKAWEGFFGEWKKAAAEMENALKAATAATGDKKLITLPEPGKVKETETAFTALSGLLGTVKDRLAQLGTGEEQVQREAEKLWAELDKGAEALARLQKEGKAAPETVKREIAALKELAELIPQLQESASVRLREEAAEKQVSAERELQDRLAGLQTQTLERRQAAWLVEVDALRAKFQEEGLITDSMWTLLLDIEQAGLANIQRQREEAFAAEMAQAQQWMAGVVAQRMTTNERLAFFYEQDLQRWSEVELAKAQKDQGPGEKLALEQQYALNREAALQRYGQELQVLYNSQGWQGMFGEPFAQALREDEQLLREWAESADQAMMMVRISGEVTSESLRRGFRNFSQGMGQNIAQAIVYKKSIGEAMREAAASTLASIAAESFMYAIYSAGLGFVRLAQHDYAAAGQAFTAAAIFGGVGAAAAVAGRMIAPAQGKGK